MISNVLGARTLQSTFAQYSQQCGKLQHLKYRSDNMAVDGEYHNTFLDQDARFGTVSIPLNHRICSCQYIGMNLSFVAVA